MRWSRSQINSNDGWSRRRTPTEPGDDGTCPALCGEVVASIGHSDHPPLSRIEQLICDLSITGASKAQRSAWVDMPVKCDAT